MIADLAISLTAYTIIFSVLVGMGRETARVLRIGFHFPGKFFSYAWLGWFTFILVLHVWHFFLPINATASFFLLAVGMVLFLRRVRKFAFLLRKKSTGWLTLASLFVSIASLVALRAMLPPANYDSGYYHLSTIRWLNEYRIVPGLGNLNLPLAYNQSFFMYAALLNLYPYFNHSHNLANSFLFLLISFEILTVTAAHFFQQLGDRRPGALCKDPLPILVIPFVIYVGLDTFRFSPSSPTPDYASCLLQLLIAFHLWRLIDARCCSHRAVSEAKFITLLSAVAITVKLSNLAYAILATVIALFWCVVRRRYRLISTWRTFRAIALVSVLLVWNLDDTRHSTQRMSGISF